MSCYVHIYRFHTSCCVHTYVLTLQTYKTWHFTYHCHTRVSKISHGMLCTHIYAISIYIEIAHYPSIYIEISDTLHTHGRDLQAMASYAFLSLYSLVSVCRVWEFSIYTCIWYNVWKFWHPACIWMLLDESRVWIHWQKNKIKFTYTYMYVLQSSFRFSDGSASRSFRHLRYTHTHARARACTHTYTNVRTQALGYKRAYTLHIHTCTHAHTHTQSRKL